jgi:hypothetical protein
MPTEQDVLNAVMQHGPCALEDLASVLGEPERGIVPYLKALVSKGKIRHHLVDLPEGQNIVYL